MSSARRSEEGAAARGGRSRGARRKLLVRRLMLVLFILYMAALTYFLFFADWYDHAPGRHWEYRYNLIPFREITRFVRARRKLAPKAVFLNLFGNVLGFLPFGFFLPVITPRLKKGGIVVLLGFLVSFAVEAVQLATKSGCYDVDDMMLNTLGAFLGWQLFRMCDWVRRGWHGRR